MNEHLRIADNRRRLPQLAQQLVLPAALARTLHASSGAELTHRRQLLQEDRFKLLRYGMTLREGRVRGGSLPPRNGQWRGAVRCRRAHSGDTAEALEVYGILLDDRLLLAVEEESRFLVREWRYCPCQIFLETIRYISGEPLRGAGADADRCVLVLEFVPQLHAVAGSRERRPVMPASAPTQVVRFQLGTSARLKVWVSTLLRARQLRQEALVQAGQERLGADAAQPLSAAAELQHGPSGTQAVTLLVSTLAGPPEEAPPEPPSVAGTEAQDAPRVPDWEIAFSDEEDGGAEAVTRHVRLVLGPRGLGMVLVGRQPVVVQEVEPDSPAYAGGIRPGDAICAVEGQDCSQLSHAEVIDMIRAALCNPRAADAWQRPAVAVPEAGGEVVPAPLEESTA